LGLLEEYYSVAGFDHLLSLEVLAGHEPIVGSDGSQQAKLVIAIVGSGILVGFGIVQKVTKSEAMKGRRLQPLMNLSVRSAHREAEAYHGLCSCVSRKPHFLRLHWKKSDDCHTHHLVHLRDGFEMQQTVLRGRLVAMADARELGHVRVGHFAQILYDCHLQAHICQIENCTTPCLYLKGHLAKFD
jgi:hypothetical protein